MQWEYNITVSTIVNDGETQFVNKTFVPEIKDCGCTANKEQFLALEHRLTQLYGPQSGSCASHLQ